MPLRRESNFQFIFGQLLIAYCNATEVNYQWTTPSCNRPQPATGNGDRDVRSSWQAVTPSPFRWHAPPKLHLHCSNRCNRQAYAAVNGTCIKLLNCYFSKVNIFNSYLNELKIKVTLDLLKVIFVDFILYIQIEGSLYQVKICYIGNWYFFMIYYQASIPYQCQSYTNWK